MFESEEQEYQCEAEKEITVMIAAPISSGQHQKEIIRLQCWSRCHVCNNVCLLCVCTTCIAHIQKTQFWREITYRTAAVSKSYTRPRDNERGLLFCSFVKVWAEALGWYGTQHLGTSFTLKAAHFSNRTETGHNYILAHCPVIPTPTGDWGGWVRFHFQICIKWLLHCWWQLSSHLLC